MSDAGSRILKDAWVMRSFVEPFTKDIAPQKVRKKTNAVAKSGPLLTSDMSDRSCVVVFANSASVSGEGGKGSSGGVGRVAEVETRWRRGVVTMVVRMHGSGDFRRVLLAVNEDEESDRDVEDGERTKQAILADEDGRTGYQKKLF